MNSVLNPNTSQYNNSFFIRAVEMLTHTYTHKKKTPTVTNMTTHRNTEGVRISIWSDVLMIFTVYTHAHRSDLDSECVMSGESSVRELVSVYNPGVTENLKGIIAKMIS